MTKHSITDNRTQVDVVEVEEEASVTRELRCCTSLVEVDKMLEMKKTLEHFADTEGLQRSNFMKTIQNVKDEAVPIMTVKYGDSAVSVNAFGSALVTKKDRKLTGFSTGMNPIFETAPKGAAPLNKRIGKLKIQAGLCLIVAGGGAGKTPLAHTLAAANCRDYHVVRVGEPLAGYAADNESVAYSIGLAMQSSSDIVLDSVKDLLSGGGSAMKSGISRDALVSLSSLASLACEAGCTIYVPINPSTPDPEVLQLLAEVSRSNATMTIVGTDSENWEFVSRQGEGLMRLKGSIKLKFNKDGLGEVEGISSSSTEVSESESSHHIAMVLSVDAMSAAIRRSMSNPS